MESDNPAQEVVAAEAIHIELADEEPAGVTQPRSEEVVKQQDDNEEKSEDKKDKLMGCQALTEIVQEEIKGEDDALNQGVRARFSKPDDEAAKEAIQAATGNDEQGKGEETEKNSGVKVAAEVEPKHKLLNE